MCTRCILIQKACIVNTFSEKRRTCMIRFIGKRLLLSIPVLLGVVFIVFAIMSLTPADPGTLILGIRATPEAVAKLNHELGFDKPFFERFFLYIKNIVLHFDFGVSYMNRKPCLQEALSYFPVTLQVAALSMFFSTVIGVSLGVFAAVKKRGWRSTACRNCRSATTWCTPSTVSVCTRVCIRSTSRAW